MINIIAIIVGALSAACTCYFSGDFTSLRALLIAPYFICYYFAFVIAVFLLLLVTSLFLGKKKPIEKPGKLSYFIVREAIDYINLFFGARIKVSGSELIKNDESYLFVCNHRSRFDPMVLVDKLRENKLLMISKPENFKIPIAGPYIRKCGFFALNRDDNRDALRTILKAVAFIKDYNISVGIYPEGTRNKHSRELLPFKAGALKIATKARVPIVVTTVEGTERVAKRFPLRTRVNLDVLAVITPEEYGNMSAQELSDKVYALMKANIDGYTEKAKARTKQTSAKKSRKI